MPLIKAHTSIIGETGYNCHARNFFKSLNKLVPVKVRNWTIGDSWKGYFNDEPHNNEYYIDNELKTMLDSQSLGTPDGHKDFPLYKRYKQLDDINIVNIVLNDNKHQYFDETFSSPSIAFNVWETTRQPEDFFNKLKKFDQVWVPSEWQRQCTIDQGINASKVKVVPEGVDIEMFKPRPESIQVEGTKFKFVIIGRWEYRKSTREMIKAFIDTFSEDEPVELIISADNRFANDDCKTTEDRLKKFGLIHKGIKVVHHLSKKEYVNLLHEADVFVSCARSEGWNLPLIEAMACGIPSMYSYWGAQLQFANSKGIPINVLGEVPANVINTESWDSNAPGNFANPDFIDLAFKMRLVYEDYDTYKKTALLESDLIREQFTWKRSAEIAYDHIQELLSPVVNNQSDDFAWVTCGNLGYMKIIEKLVESIAEFSKHKIIVYGINCEVPFTNDRMIAKTITVPDHSIYDKWYWKQYACIESTKEAFDNFIWVDGDIVVNYNVDNISEYFNEITNYPIPDIHLQEDFVAYFSNTDGSTGIQRFNERLCAKENIVRLNTIAHICMYVYNKECTWWFEEILKVYYNMPISNYIEFLTWNDEGIDNYLRSKYKFTKFLPISNFDVSDYDGDLCASNGRSMEYFISFWREDGPKNFGKIFGWQVIPEDKSKILYFHGNKDLILAKKMIDYIKAKRDNNFYDTKYFFTGKNEIANLGLMDGIEGSTLEIAHKYGWANAIFHEIYNLKDYEYNELVKVRPDDMVVDLGGNIGIFTRYAYHMGASKIITFEPDIRYYPILKQNAPPNAILFNAAIGDNIGKLMLTEVEHLGGSNVFINKNPLFNQYDVNVYTLDFLLDNKLIDKIDFLKVDIEGSEIMAFNGISDDHLSKIRNITIEYHHALLNYDEALRESLINRFHKLGFNSYLIFCGYTNELQLIHLWNEKIINNNAEI